MRQLNAWRILLRALDASERLQNNNFEEEFSSAKRYLLYLSDEGCAKPVAINDDTKTNPASKRGLGEKGLNTKSMLIPRDLEKLIRMGRKPNLNTGQLKAIR